MAVPAKKRKLKNGDAESGETPPDTGGAGSGAAGGGRTDTAGFRMGSSTSATNSAAAGMAVSVPQQQQQQNQQLTVSAPVSGAGGSAQRAETAAPAEQGRKQREDSGVGASPAVATAAAEPGAGPTVPRVGVEKNQQSGGARVAIQPAPTVSVASGVAPAAAAAANALRVSGTPGAVGSLMASSADGFVRRGASEVSTGTVRRLPGISLRWGGGVPNGDNTGISDNSTKTDSNSISKKNGSSSAAAAAAISALELSGRGGGKGGLNGSSNAYSDSHPPASVNVNANASEDTTEMEAELDVDVDAGPPTPVGVATGASSPLEGSAVGPAKTIGDREQGSYGGGLTGKSSPAQAARHAKNGTKVMQASGGEGGVQAVGIDKPSPQLRRSQQQQLQQLQLQQQQQVAVGKEEIEEDPSGDKEYRATKTWSVEELQLLWELKTKDPELPPNRVAEILFKTTGIRKTGDQCRTRWTKVDDPSIRKGSWTTQEDDLLAAAVRDRTSGNSPPPWVAISESIFKGKRTSKQCRARFMNHLDPYLRHEPWTFTENAALKAAADLYPKGQQIRWASIVKDVPELLGRSPDAARNQHKMMGRPRAVFKAFTKAPPPTPKPTKQQQQPPKLQPAGHPRSLVNLQPAVQQHQLLPHTLEALGSLSQQQQQLQFLQQQQQRHQQQELRQYQQELHRHQQQHQQQQLQHSAMLMQQQQHAHHILIQQQQQQRGTNPGVAAAAAAAMAAAAAAAAAGTSARPKADPTASAAAKATVVSGMTGSAEASTSEVAGGAAAAGTPGTTAATSQPHEQQQQQQEQGATMLESESPNSNQRTLVPHHERMKRMQQTLQAANAVERGLGRSQKQQQGLLLLQQQQQQMRQAEHQRATQELLNRQQFAHQQLMQNVQKQQAQILLQKQKLEAQQQQLLPHGQSTNKLLAAQAQTSQIHAQQPGRSSPSPPRPQVTTSPVPQHPQQRLHPYTPSSSAPPGSVSGGGGGGIGVRSPGTQVPPYGLIAPTQLLSGQPFSAPLSTTWAVPSPTTTITSSSTNSISSSSAATGGPGTGGASGSEGVSTAGAGLGSAGLPGFRINDLGNGSASGGRGHPQQPPQVQAQLPPSSVGIAGPPAVNVTAGLQQQQLQQVGRARRQPSPLPPAEAFAASGSAWGPSTSMDSPGISLCGAAPGSQRDVVDVVGTGGDGDGSVHDSPLKDAKSIAAASSSLAKQAAAAIAVATGPVPGSPIGSADGDRVVEGSDPLVPTASSAGKRIDVGGVGRRASSPATGEGRHSSGSFPMMATRQEAMSNVPGPPGNIISNGISSSSSAGLAMSSALSYPPLDSALEMMPPVTERGGGGGTGSSAMEMPPSSTSAGAVPLPLMGHRFVHPSQTPQNWSSAAAAAVAVATAAAAAAAPATPAPAVHQLSPSAAPSLSLSMPLFSPYPSAHFPSASTFTLMQQADAQQQQAKQQKQQQQQQQDRGNTNITNMAAMNAAVAAAAHAHAAVTAAAASNAATATANKNNPQKSLMPPGAGLLPGFSTSVCDGKGGVKGSVGLESGSPTTAASSSGKRAGRGQSGQTQQKQKQQNHHHRQQQQQQGQEQVVEKNRQEVEGQPLVQHQDEGKVQQHNKEGEKQATGPEGESLAAGEVATAEAEADAEMTEARSAEQSGSTAPASAGAAVASNGSSPVADGGGGASAAVAAGAGSKKPTKGKGKGKRGRAAEVEALLALKEGFYGPQKSAGVAIEATPR